MKKYTINCHGNTSMISRRRYNRCIAMTILTDEEFNRLKDLDEQFLLLQYEKQELVESVKAREKDVEIRDSIIVHLKQQLALKNRKIFGASSEKMLPEQEMMIFNEAEQDAKPNLPEPTVETITYQRRGKTKGQREIDLSTLPTEEVAYRLTEEERVCPDCAGHLHEMGVDIHQEIQIVPAQVKVVKHIRYKYACRHCDHNEIQSPVLQAPMPKRAFPNSLASASAVAHIITQKFVESSPLYRQEAALKRMGVWLSRQTMANWVLKAAGLLSPLYIRMRDELLKGDILHADETTLQVLKEPGRAAQTKSYMWLYRSGRYGPPIVIFEYQKTHAREHPLRFLAPFHGYLHSDAYIAYDGIPNVTPVGCWAHARRTFDEAKTAAGKHVGAATLVGLDFCNRIFDIEDDLHDLTPDERKAARLARSKPLLDEFKLWLDEHALTVLPKFPLGKAIGYCLGQWNKLNNFLSDGRLEIDNNRAERSIKPLVIGRKNWLFANTTAGAQSSAVLYSIIETAKENELNPFTYLVYLFEQLPNIDVTNADSIDRLSPWSPDIQDKFHVPTRQLA